MKVRELQEHLSKLNPDLDVLCYSEDKKYLVEKRDFILFDILAVSATKAERFRLDDETPYLKFKEGPNSVEWVKLDVISYF